MAFLYNRASDGSEHHKHSYSAGQDFERIAVEV